MIKLEISPKKRISTYSLDFYNALSDKEKARIISVTIDNNAATCYYGKNEFRYHVYYNNKLLGKFKTMKEATSVIRKLNY